MSQEHYELLAEIRGLQAQIERLKIERDSLAKQEASQRAGCDANFKGYIEQLRRANDLEDQLTALRKEHATYVDAVNAQPWATDEPIRVLLDRVSTERIMMKTLTVSGLVTRLDLAEVELARVTDAAERQLKILNHELSEQRAAAHKHLERALAAEAALAARVIPAGPNSVQEAAHNRDVEAGRFVPGVD